MAIFPAINERTVETDQEKIRIFIVWGLSHAGGAGELSGSAENDTPWFWEPGKAVPGCYIYDKFKRVGGQPIDLSTTDSTRSNEPHAWQPLTTGYGGGDDDEPWITTPTAPLGGWDTVFAHLWRQYTGERIFIVKMAVGGSTLADKNPGVTPYWGTAGLGSGILSNLEILMDAYWAPALAAAITMAGGDRDKVTLGGIVSMVGSSDIYSAPAMAAYQANLTAIIAHMRSVIAQPGDDLLVPWLIVKSPLPESTVAAPTLRADVATIRAAQEATAGALTNVAITDAAGMRYGADGVHLDWMGNFQLGTALYKATKAMTGYVGPIGD